MYQKQKQCSRMNDSTLVQYYEPVPVALPCSSDPANNTAQRELNLSLETGGTTSPESEYHHRDGISPMQTNQNDQIVVLLIMDWKKHKIHAFLLIVDSLVHVEWGFSASVPT